MLGCVKPLLVPLLIPFFFTLFSGCHGGKILVFPMEGSHWVNMEVLLKELHSRGHQMSMLRQSQSWFVQEHSPYYSSTPVKLVKKEAGSDLFSTAICNVLDGCKKSPFAGGLAQVSELSQTMKMDHSLTCGMLTILLETGQRSDGSTEG
ncbi:hypothetical protein MHYP_G00183330 [Metynnis hypsauchen]